jgi:predicted RNA-binding Zn-ribbon protein involved in translation (DUF1610 family)
MAMKCPWCSAENPLGTQTCRACGSKIFFTDSEVSTSGQPQHTKYRQLSSQQLSGRHCVSCGRAIAWDAGLCPYCGQDYRHQQTRGQSVPLTTPPKGTSVGKIVAGIVIAFVIILVILMVLSYVVPQVVGSTATISIYVSSTHLLYSVSYNVYIDGSLIHSGSLGPGEGVHATYSYHWSSSNPTTITVSATSTGGGFGSQSDSDSIVVSDGGTYTVNLSI